MLTIKTILKPAGDKGIGLFAKEKILANTIVWIHNRDFDREFFQTQVDHFDNIRKELIETYATLESDGCLYLCVDNARFMNHSDTPNLKIVKNYKLIVTQMVANIDINADEEITCNYREICEACKTNLGFENKESRADGLIKYYTNKQVKQGIIDDIRAALKAANYDAHNYAYQNDGNTPYPFSLTASASFVRNIIRIRYIQIVLNDDAIVITNRDHYTPKGKEITIKINLSNPKLTELVVQECDKIMESYNE